MRIADLDGLVHVKISTEGLRHLDKPFLDWMVAVFKLERNEEMKAAYMWEDRHRDLSITRFIIC
jgi:hypothetical protein